MDRMPDTLSDPKVVAVLAGLFDAADSQEAEIGAILGENPDLLEREAAEVAEVLKEALIPVSPDAGRLLYSLTRALRPPTVVEYGTSFGVSTIHLAAAVRDNGEGRVVSTEMVPEKIERAKANLAAAGLEDRVTVLEGDALETLASVEGPIGLLLLDGWPGLALPVLELVEPKLAPGALVIVDDSTQFATELSRYLGYVRDPANGYQSVAFPVADGMEISCRT
jgi:predicted O-methyltransferase YrrM